MNQVVETSSDTDTHTTPAPKQTTPKKPSKTEAPKKAKHSKEPKKSAPEELKDQVLYTTQYTYIFVQDAPKNVKESIFVGVFLFIYT